MLMTENDVTKLLYYGNLRGALKPKTLNFICILAILAVGALAMFMVQTSHQNTGDALQAGTELQGSSATNAVMLQPLKLGLALAVVADLGLMTLGLVILFKDDVPGRARIR